MYTIVIDYTGYTVKFNDRVIGHASDYGAAMLLCQSLAYPVVVKNNRKGDAIKERDPLSETEYRMEEIRDRLFDDSYGMEWEAMDGSDFSYSEWFKNLDRKQLGRLFDRWSVLLRWLQVGKGDK